MKISQISVLNFTPIKQTMISPIRKSENNIDCSNIYSYPKNYYISQFSFSGKKPSANQLLEKIGESNFPSPKIVSKLDELGVSSNFSLYNLHLDFYAGILNCKTLEEAKEKYPEFQSVINAKDINFQNLDSKSVLKKASQGKYKGIDIETITLELLKKYYGELTSIKKIAADYGISINAMNNIFELLQIPRISRNYYTFINGSNPNLIEACRKSTQKMWDEDDGSKRATARNTAYSILLTGDVQEKSREGMKTPEAQARRSTATQTRWDNDDGTMRQKAVQTASTILQTPEVKEKIKSTTQTEEYKNHQRKLTKTRWDNDDGTMRQKAHVVATTILKDPEVIAKRLATVQTEEYKEQQRQNMLRRWDSDDGTMREASRITASTILQAPEVRAKNIEALRTPEYKTKRSEIMKNIWENDDGTRRAISSFIASTVLQTPEVRKKVNDKIQSPEYREAHRLAFERHPEITLRMSEIAEEFPMLGTIINKIKRGEATDWEMKIYRTYHKKCENDMPGFMKIIGEEYHNILIEWGIKE